MGAKPKGTALDTYGESVPAFLHENADGLLSTLDNDRGVQQRNWKACLLAAGLACPEHVVHDRGEATNLTLDGCHCPLTLITFIAGTRIAQHVRGMGHTSQ